eukprot:TRINITY_DN4847_c0_g2_i4.p1 TRINITY_DN4847_c0_g2~~TRINITY_DN4847_c0_g2_i4.p1  ORF type:complete len:492 (+),score=157.50 TRINITY_DN4847_c0_g2_i4:1019-2494(+)
MSRQAMFSAHVIEQRRKAEDNIRNLAITHQEFTKNKHMAQWETKSQSKIEHNQLLRQVSQIKAERAKSLEQRKVKLADLLQKEQIMYNQEVAGLKETTSQRQEKMINRARELKWSRQEKRAQEAEELLHRKWLSEQDELRLNDGKDLAKHVHAEVIGQLSDKAERLRKEEEEKRKYDKIWEQDRQKKLQREEEDQKRTQALKNETVTILDEQIQLVKQRKAEEQRLKDEEALLMRAQWELEKQEDERIVREVSRRKLATRYDLDQSNLSRRKQREEQMRRDRELDLAVLENALAKEKEAKEEETERKRKLREDMIAFRYHLQEQMQREVDHGSQLDRLRQQELDREWKKREEQWEREAAARDKLMKEIYEEQQRQIQRKMEENFKRRMDSVKEREELEEKLADLTLKEKEQSNQVRMYKKEMADSHLAHMGVLKAEKDRENRKKALDTELMLEIKEAEKEKIQAELDRREQARAAGNIRPISHGRRKMDWF